MASDRLSESMVSSLDNRGGGINKVHDTVTKKQNQQAEVDEPPPAPARARSKTAAAVKAESALGALAAAHQPTAATAPADESMSPNTREFLTLELAAAVLAKAGVDESEALAATAAAEVAAAKAATDAAFTATAAVEAKYKLLMEAQAIQAEAVASTLAKEREERLALEATLAAKAKAEEEANVFDGSHLNDESAVTWQDDDDEQHETTVGELGALVVGGSVTATTYMWVDGLGDDWLLYSDAEHKLPSSHSMNVAKILERTQEQSQLATIASAAEARECTHATLTTIHVCFISFGCISTLVCIYMPAIDRSISVVTEAAADKAAADAMAAVEAKYKAMFEAQALEAEEKAVALMTDRAERDRLQAEEEASKQQQQQQEQEQQQHEELSAVQKARAQAEADGAAMGAAMAAKAAADIEAKYKAMFNAQIATATAGKCRG